MLKHSVGLITLVSSPLIFITMVVLPELSRPLSQEQNHQNSSLDLKIELKNGQNKQKGQMGSWNIHHQNPHFLFFTLNLPNYAQKPHCCWAASSTEEDRLGMKSLLMFESVIWRGYQGRLLLDDDLFLNHLKFR